MANTLRNLVKTGFGLGLGLYLAQLVFLVIGAAIFFPGFVMLQEKNKQNAPSSEKILPFVMMTVGVIIMGGVGIGLLADSLEDIF